MLGGDTSNEIIFQKKKKKKFSLCFFIFCPSVRLDKSKEKMQVII